MGLELKPYQPKIYTSPNFWNVDLHIMAVSSCTRYCERKGKTACAYPNLGGLEKTLQCKGRIATGQLLILS